METVNIVACPGCGNQVTFERLQEQVTCSVCGKSGSVVWSWKPVDVVLK